MIDHVKPTARIPAVQGQFGPRLVTYTTQLPPGSIETILGHDPRSKHWKRLPDDISALYTHLQRATTKSRLDAIIRYIRYRFVERAVIAGAFPAISIAVQNPTPFEKFDVPDAGIGVLHFDLSKRNRRVIVDGLGRGTAAMELVELSEDFNLSEEAREALKKLISEFSLPAVFYIPAPETKPLTLEEMQQLFHDFNFKAVAVPARVAIALDHSDLYIALTNRVGRSDLFQQLGGMEIKAASLGKKSTAIVVQQNLLRFMRGATEGERFLEGANNAEITDKQLTEETIEKFEERITQFITAMVDSMGAEGFKDREAMHLTAPGWGALGVIFHDLAVRLNVPDIEAAARKIGKLNWHRSAPMWNEIVRERVDKEGNTVLGLAGGGAQTRRFITQALRDHLGLTPILKDRGLLGDESPSADDREAAE